jgi:nitroimidazol reductase NimA-like FMN-containing flavoprotein (pyridoxamine 5'-phosphate oxidase superfamily)
MGVIEGRTWLEHLSADECWGLLDRTEVGRVGVVVDGDPEVFPVNFVVDDETIVFRTDRGSKLHGLLDHPSCCFEVDGVGPKLWSGWSVLVKGRAEEIHGGAESAQAAALGLRYWAFGEKSHWIRIRPHEVSGRRLYRPTGGQGGGPA